MPKKPTKLELVNAAVNAHLYARKAFLLRGAISELIYDAERYGVDEAVLKCAAAELDKVGRAAFAKARELEQLAAGKRGPR